MSCDLRFGIFTRSGARRTPPRSLLAIVIFVAAFLWGGATRAEPDAATYPSKVDHCVQISLSELTAYSSISATYTKTVRNICKTPIDFYYCRGLACGTGDGFYRSVVVIREFRTTTLTMVMTTMDKDPTQLTNMWYLACVSHGGRPSVRGTEAGVCSLRPSASGDFANVVCRGGPMTDSLPSCDRAMLSAHEARKMD